MLRQKGWNRGSNPRSPMFKMENKGIMKTIEVNRSPLICSRDENGRLYTFQEYKEAVDKSIKMIRQRYLRRPEPDFAKYANDLNEAMQKL